MCNSITKGDLNMDMLPVKLQRIIGITFEDSTLSSWRITEGNNTTIISLRFQQASMLAADQYLGDQGGSSQPLQSLAYRRKTNKCVLRDRARQQNWLERQTSEKVNDEDSHVNYHVASQTDFNMICDEGRKLLDSDEDKSLENPRSLELNPETLPFSPLTVNDSAQQKQFLKDDHVSITISSQNDESMNSGCNSDGENEERLMAHEYSNPLSSSNPQMYYTTTESPVVNSSPALGERCVPKQSDQETSQMLDMILVKLNEMDSRYDDSYQTVRHREPRKKQKGQIT